MYIYIHIYIYIYIHTHTHTRPDGISGLVYKHCALHQQSIAPFANNISAVFISGASSQDVESRKSISTLQRQRQ